MGCDSPNQETPRPAQFPTQVPPQVPQQVPQQVPPQVPQQVPPQVPNNYSSNHIPGQVPWQPGTLSMNNIPGPNVPQGIPQPYSQRVNTLNIPATVANSFQRVNTIGSSGVAFPQPQPPMRPFVNM